MKFLSILLITAFINACGGSKAAVANVTEEKQAMSEKVETMQNPELVFEYTEQSRGVYKMVKISPEMISSKLAHDGVVETKPCDKVFWNDLMTEMEPVNLKEIPKLEAPSKTHQFDAKPMANLKITRGKNVYSTVTFDAGNPHEKLSGLVNKILTAVENKD